MPVKILVYIDHVEHRALHDDERSLRQEFLVLLPQSHLKLAHGQRSNIGPRLDAKTAVGQREEERECAEVIAQRQVCPESARHGPEVPRPVNLRLFIREVVREALHSQPETLGQNIVLGGRHLLCPLHVKLVGLVGNGLADVRIALRPHSGLCHLIDRVQLVPPDRDVGVVILTLEDLHQLHFDCVADTVTYGALGACRDNDVVIQL